MAKMDIHRVLDMLPHRYPFLLIDRVVECVPGQSITAIKNVTVNEPFFQGHFPHRRVMPGVLVLEAMAQATGILAFETMGVQPDETMVYYLVGVDKARFKKPVEPGDQLLIQATLIRELKGIWKFSGTAAVDGNVVASGEFMSAKRDLDP